MARLKGGPQTRKSGSSRHPFMSKLANLTRLPARVNPFGHRMKLIDRIDSMYSSVYDDARSSVVWKPTSHPAGMSATPNLNLVFVVIDRFISSAPIAERSFEPNGKQILSLKRAGILAWTSKLQAEQTSAMTHRFFNLLLNRNTWNGILTYLDT